MSSDGFCCLGEPVWFFFVDLFDDPLSFFVASGDEVESGA